MRPLLRDVEYKVGDIVFWDDRTGWRGKITAIYSGDLIDVEYDNGMTDTGIDIIHFTKEG